MRQEQMPAQPGAFEVADGLVRVQLPIRFTGLGHVNTYVIEDDEGVMVVDPGLPTRGSWTALTAGLKEWGIPVGRVRSVLVTHSHPDHFGGARRLVRVSGAEMVTHDSYRTWWKRRGAQGRLGELSGRAAADEARARSGVYPWHDPAAARGWRRRLRSMGPKHLFLGSMRSPVPDRRLSDGEVFGWGGRRWVAIHTPGHTGDHLCIYAPDDRLLLSGDHVLPTITPHVAALGAGPDPLGAYLASLDKVAKLDLRMTLPAHGQPITDLEERVEAIRQHHHRRFRQLADASERLGPATTEALSRAIYPERHWGYLADSETYAHLIHLEALGLAQRIDGSGAPRFTVALGT